jgi:DNA-binding response OmpR family regulator
MKPLVLIIDDESLYLDNIRNCVQPTFDVHRESTGEAALEWLERERPVLIVLDWILEPELPGKLRGRDVLARIKGDPALQRIPVMVLSWWAEAERVFAYNPDEHVMKQDFNKQFGVRFRRLMSRAATWPFDSAPERTLSLLVRNHARVDIVSGIIESHEQTQHNLELDLEKLKALAHHDVFSYTTGEWRPTAVHIRDHLFRIMQEHKDLQQVIRNVIKRPHRVNVAGNHNMLEVPLEFLPDLNGKGYFVLQHAFSRSLLVADVVFEPSISPKLLNDLHRRNQPLRVLLVASNSGDLPGVEHEIEQIGKLLADNPKGLRTELKLLKTSDGTLTLAAIHHELEKNPYHIVHYAGHGEFNEQRVQDHRLPIKSRDVTRPDYLPATALSTLWFKHRPSLFYMSCCRGAAIGSRKDLIHNDLLGLVDAAVLAGVPTVLGFRWPVTDTGACLLATAFYDNLLQTGRPDHALSEARRKAYRVNADDPAWLSPVLVMQPPS